MYATYETADWQRLERDWTDWWQGELDRPLVVLHTGAPGGRLDASDVDIWQPLTQFPTDTPVERVLAHGQAWLDATHYHADAYPHWWPNYGPGIMAGFLGSRVEHGDRTAWFSPLGVDSLADLTLKPDPENAWWQTLQAVTRAASARWGDRITIGYTDLGGGLDILAHLRGTKNLLLDLIDAPDEVARLVPEITRLWLHYHAALDAVPRRAGCGHRTAATRRTLLGRALVSRPWLLPAVRLLLHDLAQGLRALRAAGPRSLLPGPGLPLLPPGRHRRAQTS
jgi:hypothetical protein